MGDENKTCAQLLEELTALRDENLCLRTRIRQNDPIEKNGQTILVIDDNTQTRQLVAEMVEELGFTAIARPSSQEAMAAFAGQPDKIDLIISDIVMPGGDGPHLLKQITKISRPPKIIFMSGYAEDEIVHDAVYQIQDSKAAFIKKPFTLTELEALIMDQLPPTGSKG